MLNMNPPQIAIVGAGVFVRTQYIPRLADLSDNFILKAIWSRSEESARIAVELARKHFPEVQCKYGDDGFDDIIQDHSIVAVAVVLAGQFQVAVSLKFIKAGKHVLQEKPAAATVDEAEAAISSYNFLCGNCHSQPIWAVAENYRFEPAFVQGKKQISDIGEVMSIQVIVEGSMNSSNPYFSSSWRRNFTGGFILDMGVHFVAGLRMLAGCEISSVSALVSHVDQALPPPDNISALFHLENGWSGVFAMVVSARSSPRILWRFVGLKGTLQVERGSRDGKHGYLLSLGDACSFYPFSGVTEELKIFLHDISQASVQNDGHFQAEARSSFVEGARDVAVLEAMLDSGRKCGALMKVKRI